MDIGGHSQIAERAHKDCIEIARQLSEAVCRNCYSIREVTVSAPIELRHLDRGPGSVDDFYSLGDHFNANAVARDYRDTFLQAHRKRDYQLSRSISIAGTSDPQNCARKICPVNADK